MRDLLANLQNRAAQLDAQMTELSKALDHWRLLGAEYEALADEVNQARTKFATDDKATQQAQQAALVRIRRDFDGQLVDHQTVCDLFGARQGQTITRTIDHIASAIGRRLDYVRQNTETLEKKVEAVVNKLSALQLRGLTEMLVDDDKAGGDQEQDGQGGGDDDDLDGPVTDIVEQLDEDGNVVDVQLHTPSNTQSHVMEALKKAGIEELPVGGPAATKKSADAGAGPKELKGPKDPKDAAQEQTQSSKLKPNTSLARKGLSFSDDTKPGDHTASSSSQPQSFAAQRLENIMRSAKDQETIVDTSSLVVPEDEAEDDAALRREMLEYSMSEIGPIVAQLDLEEGTSDDDEGYDDFYDEELDDDDDDEDEHGRSKYSVIDETYRERMRELERKLGVAPLENPSTLAPSSAAAGDGATATTTDGVAESLGRIRVSGLTAATGSASNGAPANGDLPSPRSSANLTSVLKEPTENFRTKAKVTGSDAKKVSFASSVDIAPLETVPPAAPPAAPSAAAKTKAPAEPVVDPMSEVIVERASSKHNGSSSNEPPAAPDATQKPKRVSRFKKARGDGATAPDAGLPKGPHQAPVRFLDEDRTVAPEGPEGKTHAEEVIERTAVTEPKEPHELDAGILMQEAATEYHKTRNRLIQQQGGFLQASESAVVSVGQEDGGPRISKFKAAKLGKQFMSP